MTGEDLRTRFAEILAHLDGLPEHAPLYANEPQVNARILQACTKAAALISQLAGREDVFLRQLQQFIDETNTHGAVSLVVCRGVLEAARDHFVGGLHRLRELVEADVFADLLEMADYLHQRRYHLPAGSIAGAVLEDSLRKLCGKHGVTWTEHSAISKLNGELYKANVYSKPLHGQVDAWGKLRNEIDHHNFANPSDIDADDVKRMIDGVRDFVVKYLG